MLRAATRHGAGRNDAGCAMTKALGDFIRALRAADVRISPSEAIDAGATLALLGYEDRATLKTGLAQALAKSAPEKEIFERAFDAFFTFTPIAAQRQEPRDDAQSGEPQSSQPDEQDEPGDGGQQEQEQGTGGEGGTSGNPAERGLIELLESGDRAELAIRLADAAQIVAVNDIRLFTQRGLYTLRILERMGADDLDDAIASGDRSGDESERVRAQTIAGSARGVFVSTCAIWLSSSWLCLLPTLAAICVRKFSPLSVSATSSAQIWR